MNKFEMVPFKKQSVEDRIKNFKEVYIGYDEESAILEATRCLNCKFPRCVKACPVNIDIPGFIQFIKNGEFESAIRRIFEFSSLPAVCGRVCPQEKQCEGSCVVGIKGQPVNIGMLERFVADWGFNESIELVSEVNKNGKKVAVIGSGPSGLTCAGDLAKMGYDVTIFEALERKGGILDYGIPEFRLPKNKVIKREIDRIEKLDVKIQTGIFVGKDITIDDILGNMGFLAVYIGCGASNSKSLGVKGENGKGIFTANEFLTKVNLAKIDDEDNNIDLEIGEKIAIIGGGNVAMDVARTAIRLGKEVHIIYRRSREQLPARQIEINYTEEEGIIFDLFINPKEIILDENNRVKAIKFIRMELGDIDASDRPCPVEILNSEFFLEFDTVILSLGTDANSIIGEKFGVDTNDKNLIIVDENMQTSRVGVYAGGDAVTGPLTVIRAMGDGKIGAKSIDGYIKKMYV